MFNDIQQLFHDSSIPEIINFMNVKPMLINRYKRNYFQSADKNYRITVDTNLVFYNFSFQSISFLKMFNFGSNVILELKYQPNEDLTANEVTNHFPFRMTKMSKYVIGIEKIFL
jgi:SPX domain protein involved in polyphosphate accumulation